MYVKTIRENLQRYPLIIVTLCYGAGIALSFFFPSALFRATFTIAIMLVLAVICWWLKLNGLLLFCVAICFLMSGAMHAGQRRLFPDKPFISTALLSEKTDTVILGTIAEIELGNGQVSKGLIELHYYRTDTMPHFHEASGLVLLSLQGNWPRTVLPGDTVSVRCILKPPTGNKTPGVFNYAQHLARRNIYLRAAIVSPLFIQPVQVAGRRGSPSLKQRVERIRTLVAFQLNELLPEHGASLYRALLIGDRSGLSHATLESFKGAGVMHILAISGMHMALLGFFLFQTIFWLLRRSSRVILTVNARKLALITCLLPLLGYTLLAGGAAPVMRSFIMSVFVITALTVNRIKSPLTLLAGAGLLLLMLDPLTLESASFQLSFAAVASIIMFAPCILNWFHPARNGHGSEKPRHRDNLVRWIYGAVSITISATLGTLPLLLYHFNRFSLVTIPANLIIEPLICLWALPFGFLALPFLAISPSLATFLLQTGMVGLSFSGKTAAALSSLPLSTLWLPDPSPWLIAAYYLSLVLLFLCSRAERFTRFALIGLLACLFLFLFPLTGLNGIFRKETRVTFIDIGHGSASLIELAGGRNILIDGGGKTAPGFDSGEKILAPFLWRLKIARLDDIIITHEDADHYNGIPSLISRFRPKRIWLTSLTTTKPGFRHLCLMAEKAAIDLAVPENEVIFSEQGSQLTVLSSAHHNLSEGWNALYEDDNGLVLRLDTPSFSILFPGDITKRLEQELIARREHLSTDILLSPHHGSSTSNSVAFLAAVQPAFMVVSTADKEQELFPSPVTLKNAAQQKIRVLTTSMDGSITVSETKNGYAVRGYRGAMVHAPPVKQRFYPVTPR